MKNWDAIVRDLSSPESSDAEDDLNVVSVQKNAKRVAEILHGAIPTLDPNYRGDAPKGMNNLNDLREQLARSAVESRRSGRPPFGTSVQPHSSASTAAATTEGSAEQKAARS